MFGVGDGDTGAGCEICSGLTTKTPWHSSGVFIVNFEHDLHLLLGFSDVDFVQVNAGWVLGILMTRFLLTNGIFDIFDNYFVVIFRSIKLFFTVNINNLNNYLI